MIGKVFVGVVLSLAVFCGNAAATSSAQCDTVVDVAINNNFTILVRAVQEADLVGVLNATDLEVTVFAPTDLAFSNALEALNLSAEELFDDVDLLTSVLQMHVVPKYIELPVEVDVATLNPQQTLSIQPIIIAGSTANVIAPGVKACKKSVVYPIDAVLLPQSNEAEAPAPSLAASSEP